MRLATAEPVTLTVTFEIEPSSAVTGEEKLALLSAPAVEIEPPIV